MTHINQNARHTLYFSLFALLIAIAAGILTARWVTSPIKRLNEAAREIARGEMDRTVAITRPAEIGELANTFNNMAAKLKKTFDQLQDEIAERKQAEDAIRESEERFRRLLQEVPTIAIQGYRLDGTTTYWNQASERLYGYTKEEAIGRSLLDLIVPPEMQKQVKEAVKFMTETGQPIPSAELSLMKKDGSRVEVFSNHALIKLPGLPAELFCLDVDLSERKRAEEGIKAAELRYRTLFEEAPVMYVTFRIEDGEPIIKSCNQAFVNAMDYPKGQIIGRHLTDFLSDDSIVKMKAGLPGLLDGNTVVGERELIAKEGRTVYTLVRAIRELDSQGRLAGIRAMFTDITDRKKAEEKLRLAEFSIESSSLATFWFGRQGNVVRVNEAACRSLGYTREELMRMTVKGFDPDFQADEKWDATWEEIKARRNYVVIETRHCSKEGRIFPVEVVSSYFEYGEKEYIFSFVRDISDRRRMEEEKVRLEAQLNQAQKMEAIGTLAGGIAHDFNNILSAIFGYTEMAINKVGAGDRLRHYLEQIHKAGERARDLVKQILTFSRQKEQERKPMLIAPVIAEGIKLLRSSLPTTIDIRHDIDDESATVLADPTQIHQVLMNLCTNASHAMREKGGALIIELVRESVKSLKTLRPLNLNRGEYVKLIVSDTGHGIDPAIMDRVFDPFFTSKSPGEGTGLGLSVVYGIVRNHGGAIDVSSEPGKGTKVAVYFPLIEDEETIRDEAQEPIQVGSEHILFIDDEETLAELGGMMLTSLGYRVTSMTSSIAALEAFRAKPHGFDLVITDMTMPSMRGDHLAMELLKIRPDIPIILCTGYSEAMTEEKAAGLGMRGYLMKPLTLQDLGNVIWKTLNLK
jgi:PAS domain S-box-containing protein